jgi:thiol:disulfide interchange protein
MNPRRFALAAALVALVVLPRSPLRAESEYPAMGPDIYDVHADGSAQVGEALARAAADHKRVILVFGANWCIWCRRLHATFENDPRVSAALAKDFIVVRIDINARHGKARNAALNDKYGNPIEHGIPVLVVLDSDGKQLTTKDSGELEDGNGHSPAKILEFLSAWAPTARP